MSHLHLRENILGFELRDGDRPVALYRAREELPQTESPKPCFAPIYTPEGALVTEYRPADHQWHTGLYFGWVHVNDANLWGGGWYLPEKGGYELVEHTHGSQRHEAFSMPETPDTMEGTSLAVGEDLTWLDADGVPMATEVRTYTFGPCPGGYAWHIDTRITPTVDEVTMGASRAARYSGLMLRMGPPFAEAHHLSSEGLEGHEAIMGQRARWVSAAGAAGGMVVMMDHPDNPRHPVTWFTRKNLLGAGLLMEGDLSLTRSESLHLQYGFTILAEPAESSRIAALYAEFAASP